MNKTNLKRLIKIIVLVLPIVLFIAVGQQFLFLHFDENRIRLDGFYEEDKNTLDVVFLGSSEVYAGYAPALAYEEFGFTSYPYVLGNNLSSFFIPQIQDVLRTQSPQLMVVEINAFLYKDDTMLSDEGKLRRYVDNVPMSSVRFQTIKEMNYDNKLSCLVPFIKYHSKWKDLSDNMSVLENRLYLHGQKSLLKGMATNTTVYAPTNTVMDVSSDFSQKPLDPTLEQHLIDLLDYCKEQNLQNIVFTRFPHVIHPGEVYDCYQRSNRAEEIIRQYGYDFINFERLAQDVGIDSNADFYNNEHLNVFGQKKLTAYLGRLITENYNVTPGPQAEENRTVWLESVKYSRLYFQYAETESKNNSSQWLYEDKTLLETLRKMSTSMETGDS